MLTLVNFEKPLKTNYKKTYSLKLLAMLISKNALLRHNAAVLERCDTAVSWSKLWQPPQIVSYDTWYENPTGLSIARYYDDSPRDGRKLRYRPFRAVDLPVSVRREYRWTTRRERHDVGGVQVRGELYARETAKPFRPEGVAARQRVLHAQRARRRGNPFQSRRRVRRIRGRATDQGITTTRRMSTPASRPSVTFVLRVPMPPTFVFRRDTVWLTRRWPTSSSPACTPCP